MMKSLQQNTVIRILINVIVGVVLFQVIFGLVFNGTASGAIESLVRVAVGLIKVIIVLALAAGTFLVLTKGLTRKGVDNTMNFNREQLIKGAIIGVLALVSIGLLSNLFGGGYGSYQAGPGYYGHGGGEGAVYGYGGGSGVTGLLNNILSLLITLMSVALVVFLALGAYKAAAPYLTSELGSLFKSLPKNKCEKCGKELSDGWQLCPYCGAYAVQAIPLPEPVRQAAEESAPTLQQEAVSEGTEEFAGTEESASTPATTSPEKPALKTVPQKFGKKKKK